jgi:hypothetical protein
MVVGFAPFHNLPGDYVVISIVLAVLLAFVTYALGDLVARALVGPAPEFNLALRQPVSPSQQA